MEPVCNGRVTRATWVARGCADVPRAMASREDAADDEEEAAELASLRADLAQKAKTEDQPEGQPSGSQKRAADERSTTAAGPSASRAGAEELAERLVKVEMLGEEVLTERQQMVELDRQRNTNREALGALRRTERSQGSEESAAQKYWLYQGEHFVRRKHGDARAMLEEEQKRLDGEIEALRLSVKKKSSALCELDPSIAGGSNVHRSFVSLHGVSAAQLEGLLS